MEQLAGFSTAEKITGLELVTHMVDALILLIPLAMGAGAALLQTVAGLRGEIISWMSFLLRNLLNLRGVIVAIITDVTSLITPLFGTMFSAVGQLINVLFTNATKIIAETVTASFVTARTLAGSITSILNTTIDFVSENIRKLTNFLGGTTVVRLIGWFATALPAMLTALVAAGGGTLSTQQSNALGDLSRRGRQYLERPAATAWDRASRTRHGRQRAY